MHQPALEKAETLDMPVHCHDHARRADTALGHLGLPDAMAMIHAQNRTVLTNLHPRGSIRQRLSQPSHIGGGVQHHRPRRIQPMSVIAGSAALAHRRLIQQFIGLAKLVQMPGIGDIRRHTAGCRRAIDLAALGDDLVIQSIFITGIKGKFDGAPVQRQLRAVIAQITSIIIRGQHMRQINHEARIAACRALADPPGFQ